MIEAGQLVQSGEVVVVDHQLDRSPGEQGSRIGREAEPAGEPDLLREVAGADRGGEQLGVLGPLGGGGIGHPGHPVAGELLPHRRQRRGRAGHPTAQPFVEPVQPAGRTSGPVALDARPVEGGNPQTVEGHGVEQPCRARAVLHPHRPVGHEKIQLGPPEIPGHRVVVANGPHPGARLELPAARRRAAANSAGVRTAGGPATTDKWAAAMPSRCR